MSTEPLPTFEALARAFYEVDPLNTCCVPNALHDEYAPEARATLGDMEAGLNLHAAISASLVLFFSIDKKRADRHAVEVIAHIKTNRIQG